MTYFVRLQNNCGKGCVWQLDGFGNTVCMGSMYILVLCRMFLRGAIKLPRSVRLLDWFLFDYFDIGVREQDCIYSTLYL